MEIKVIGYQNEDTVIETKEVQEVLDTTSFAGEGADWMSNKVKDLSPIQQLIEMSHPLTFNQFKVNDGVVYRNGVEQMYYPIPAKFIPRDHYLFLNAKEV